MRDCCTYCAGQTRGSIEFMKAKTCYHSCRLQVVSDPADFNITEETEKLYFLVVYLAGHTTNGLIDWACQSISGMSAQLMTLSSQAWSHKYLFLNIQS
jgi:uncharacterized membrane protein